MTHEGTGPFVCGLCGLTVLKAVTARRSRRGPTAVAPVSAQAPEPADPLVGERQNA
ncbi:hypothetical protein J7I97_10980 [Streptomyces sp. ISL-87]|uniref:hypothetical protein n=1 Tax=Streptomyces sp. ISL-87 TaxID=2819188 RepID=UPI001BEBB98F|nr:hypothetical protein [Streptomyces sp. ISL-87]MBT2608789.1 hypothetical protein [Streptomyces sp. ISL-87]